MITGIDRPSNGEAYVATIRWFCRQDGSWQMLPSS